MILATHKIIKSKIDLVITGINNGPNMGEDILYSGTVAAAIEAMNLGLPALAVSMDFGTKVISKMEQKYSCTCSNMTLSR